jgi:hypothetical protein
MGKNQDRMAGLRAVATTYLRQLQAADVRVRAAVAKTVNDMAEAKTDEERVDVLMSLLSNKRILRDSANRLELMKVQF